MDGVLYRGAEVLPGVKELLDALTLRERPVMLATNNSMSTPEAYERKLAAMGLDIPASAVITSALATRDYLLQTLPEGAGIYVIGMPALREQLFEGTSFHPVQYGEEQPAAVVIGLDLEFTYAKLKAAHEAIQRGALFIATNADTTLPTEAGLVPGAGSIVAALAAASGQRPIVIGKPETPMLEMAMTRMGAQPEETVMLGDRLDTDILAGERAGMPTVLVLTGVSTREDLSSAEALPDVVVSDLPSLVEAITAEPSSHDRRTGRRGSGAAVRGRRRPARRRTPLLPTHAQRRTGDRSLAGAPRPRHERAGGAGDRVVERRLDHLAGRGGAAERGPGHRAPRSFPSARRKRTAIWPPPVWTRWRGSWPATRGTTVATLPGPFDLVFIDAEKDDYVDHFEAVARPRAARRAHPGRQRDLARPVGLSGDGASREATSRR